MHGMYANHAYGSRMVCVQNECIDDATCKHAQHAHYACLRIISSGFFILAKFVLATAVFAVRRAPNFNFRNA